MFKQIIGGQTIPVSGTVVPLTITSRGGSGATIGGQITSTSAQIVRNINAPNSITTTTVLPIAKVLPQPQTVGELVQQQQQQQPIQVVAVSSANLVAQQAPHQQNVFLHTRSPNPSAVQSSVVPTTFLPTTSTLYYESISTNSSATGGTMLSISAAPTSSNMTLSNISAVPSSTGLATSAAYAPVSNSNSSSFAVVPSSNRAGGQPMQSMISQPSANGQASITSLPLRFNPHLLVDNAQHQLLQSHISTQSSNIQTINSNTHHIITMQPSANARTSSDGQSTNHTAMLIPMSAKAAVTLANLQPAFTSAVTTSPRSGATRKRDIEG